MGLDIYTGTLTRYYSGNWKTVTQQYAEQNNIKYNIVRPQSNNPDDEKTAVSDPDLLSQGIIGWREFINQSLGNDLSERMDWEENNTKEYFTDKPNWDSYGALILWAIYTEQKQRIPEYVEDWTQDRIFNKFQKKGTISIYDQLVNHAECWLPGEFDFTFKADSIEGKKVTFGSNIQLLRQLNKLNGESWHENEDVLLNWQKSIEPNVKKTEEKAKFGFSILYRITQLSVAHKMPLKLDY